MSASKKKKPLRLSDVVRAAKAAGAAVSVKVHTPPPPLTADEALILTRLQDFQVATDLVTLARTDYARCEAEASAALNAKQAAAARCNDVIGRREIATKAAGEALALRKGQAFEFDGAFYTHDERQHLTRFERPVVLS